MASIDAILGTSSLISFGLYVGLFNYLHASSVDVDKWRRDGTLVDNIIKKFGNGQNEVEGSTSPGFFGTDTFLSKVHRLGQLRSPALRTLIES